VKEAELVKPTTEFLAALGYRAYSEVPFLYRLVDLYAVDDKRRTVAVELKINNWQRALRQARTCLLAADAVYVGLSERYVSPPLAHSEMFAALGIGLLSIGTERVTVLVGPVQSPYAEAGFKEDVLLYLSGITDREVRRSNEPGSF